MRRSVAAGALGLVLGAVGAATAHADEPPPLNLPGGAALPVAPEPAPAPSPPAFQQVSPLFRPPFRPIGRPALPTLRPIGPDEPADDLPPLTTPLDVAPSSSRSPAPGPPNALDPTPPRRPGAPPPIVLESTPIDALDPLAGPRPRSTPGRSMDRPDPPTPPARRGRLFGRFQPAPSASASARRDADDRIKVSPRDDPAADAALKRRIESQARQAAGNHLRSLDVRVVDRSVILRARADRPWHRRGLRRTLEALPSLAGLKADVVIED